MRLSRHGFPLDQRFLDLVNLRVYAARDLQIDALWNSRDVRSGYWRLYVNNRDGAGLRLADGERYELDAQRLHLVPAWVSFSCENAVRIHHHFAHFELLGIPSSTVRSVFPAPFALPAAPELEARFCAMTRRLAQARHQNLAGDLLAKSVILEVMSLAIAALPPRDLARCELSIHAQTVFEPALGYIDQNLNGPILNADLARLCHMSEDHFIRRFRDELGQTPAQYVIERRVAEAARRLRYSDDSIERVAVDTGFANRHYFSRVFARQLGMPPARYRQAYHP